MRRIATTAARSLAILTLAAGGLAGLMACDSGPTFNGIQQVKVRHIGTGGLVEKTLTQDEEKRLKKCLYNTREISESQALRDLLQTTYLLEISDSKGDRSFELYTMENLKGNKGKYYNNRCVYAIIANAAG